MSTRLTGSRVGLALLCGYAFRPAAVMHPQATGGEAADLGTAEHELIEAEGDPEKAAEDAFAQLVARDLRLEDAIARNGLSDAAAADLVAMHEAFTEWWPVWSAGLIYEREVPFAWDVARWSARRLPSSGQRDYSAAGGTEIPLTVDAVQVDTVARVGTVIDWKTGRLPQPRAAEHPQLLTAALCLSELYALERVRVVVVRVRPGWVSADEAWVDSLDLLEHGGNLARLALELHSATPNPGRHCTECHCPALSACEGPRALAARAPALAAALPVVVETESQAAAVLASAKAIRAYLAALEAGAVTWAQAHGGVVRLGDRAWSRVTKARRTIDLTRAETALRLRFGAKLDSMIRVKRTLSISEVEKAAASTAPRGKRGEASGQTIAELEATGGLRLSAYEIWEEGATSSAPAPEPVGAVPL
jgi:hypothetical protein